MSKCENCIYENYYYEKCPASYHHVIRDKNGDVEKCLKFKPNPKPNRFEQFREQTATIDGLVEWLSQQPYRCPFCEYKSIHCGEFRCKDGIKAYWEGVEE